MSEVEDASFARAESEADGPPGSAESHASVISSRRRAATIRKDEIGVGCLEIEQFAKQPVVFRISDFGTIFGMIQAIVPIEFASELLEPSLRRRFRGRAQSSRPH